MMCRDLEAFIGPLSGCETTDVGVRFRTHCLYPSFGQVHVFIVKYGDGFRVHDGGESAREAWLHGRDENIISTCLKVEATRYHLALVEGALVSSVEKPEWLPSAILAVANASAAAASAAIAKINAAAEETLVERIHELLTGMFPQDRVARKYPVIGRSGKEHTFDFALLDGGVGQIVMDAVLPHPGSISAKYVAFSDTEAPDGGKNFHKFAVFDRPLAPDDVSLMAQVAEIVPLAALAEGSRRVMLHAQ